MKASKGSDEFCLRQPVMSDVFSSGGVVQASLGNQISLVIYQSESEQQSIVCSGMTYVPVDET
jgi:hypothetical protein